MPLTKNRIGSNFMGMTSQVVHFLLIPVFLVLFILLYNPYGLREVLNQDSDQFSLNISIILLICMGVLIISRCTLFALRKYFSITFFAYGVICFFEVVTIGLFESLYLCLKLGGLNYFAVLARCFLVCFSILPYPYVIIGLILYIQNTKNNFVNPENDTLVRFYDENKRLKFVIAQSAVLYIGAAENYVEIYYLDGLVKKKTTVRTSMRSVEEKLVSYGIVRCHRSFIINPAHVKMIEKDSFGILMAVLDTQEKTTVPVSKRYYDSVLSLL